MKLPLSHILMGPFKILVMMSPGIFGYVVWLLGDCLGNLWNWVAFQSEITENVIFKVLLSALYLSLYINPQCEAGRVKLPKASLF